MWMSPNGHTTILANRLAFNIHFLTTNYEPLKHHGHELKFHFLQVIYNETMMDQPDPVRAALTFQSARRSMVEARKKSIPPAPSTLEEIIAGLEANQYPPLYQDMYLGYVHHDRKRKYFRTLN